MLESEVMGVPGASRVDQQSEEGDAAPVAEESTLPGTSLIPADVEEDMDMLADVRQMAAAAAAAGREKTSFEDQLQPVERYAMRFLELWDPRVNNLAIEAQVLSFSASVFLLDI
jgi:E1A-binding protein p400